MKGVQKPSSTKKESIGIMMLIDVANGRDVVINKGVRCQAVSAVTSSSSAWQVARIRKEITDKLQNGMFCLTQTAFTIGLVSKVIVDESTG